MQIFFFVYFVVFLIVVFVMLIGLFDNGNIVLIEKWDKVFNVIFGYKCSEEYLVVIFGYKWDLDVDEDVVYVYVVVFEDVNFFDGIIVFIYGCLNKVSSKK